MTATTIDVVLIPLMGIGSVMNEFSHYIFECHSNQLDPYDIYML